jgi:class 3 adenylate cyclase/pimeloyl-ACP methyl ester carboxylesterase
MPTPVPDTRYATSADGLRIAYQTKGGGPLDLVLLNQLSCIDAMWDDPVFGRSLDRLAKLGRLVVFDLRGSGSSDPVPLGAIPTIDTWSDDVLAVLDCIESRGAVLIGDGLGGGSLALFFAATHPDRVERLVLLNTAARWLKADDYQIGHDVDQITQHVDGVLAFHGTGVIGTVIAPGRADDESFLRWHGRFERLVMSPTTAKALAEWALNLDLRAILGSVRVPTLVLQSECAATRPVGFGQYLCDEIPEAKLVILPGGDTSFYGGSASDMVDHIEEFVTGARPQEEEQRVLTTILFTDIVSSTEQASHLGDMRWTELLDQHDSLVEREVSRHRGRKVKSTGDGVLAAFDGPARAIRCALAIRDGVRGYGLEVRAGLHTGECAVRGDDLGGISVHTAARVSALAGPGEVLVSRTVVDLVAGSGIAFEDRGDHALKGVPGTWKIFAVGA